MAGFSVARFALGLAEGGNFPGAVKTVGLWHPKSERAMSTGLFNAGSNVGVILAACLVPLIVEVLGWGWPAAFYVTGALGFLWLVFWWAMYDRSRTTSAGIAGRVGSYPQRSARPAGPASPGSACWNIARLGPTRPACLSPVRSGGSTSTGRRNSSRTITASIWKSCSGRCC